MRAVERPRIPGGFWTSTYSIAGRCARTGMFGMAITTSSIAVGARCVWVAAGVGAVATQNVTDPRLGRLGLDLLARGYHAKAVIDELVRAGAYPEYRQLACVDRNGHSATWSGSKVLGTHAEVSRRDVAAAGNLLKRPEVVEAMVEAFEENTDEHLAERLLKALAAGKAAGGEIGQDERSAALVVFDREPFPLVDLRVDWNEDNPVQALAELWERYRPEMDSYVIRAIEPEAAPAFDAEKHLGSSGEADRD